MDSIKQKLGSLMSGEAQYLAIAESRIGVVFPAVRRLVEHYQAETLLDFGGGDGLFLDEHLPPCVTTACHYDRSLAMRRLALTRLAAKTCIVAASCEEMETSFFDVITLLAVWMEFPSDQAAKKTLKSVARLLKPSGHLIAAVTHPCFREVNHSTFHTNFSNLHYLEAGRPFSVTVTDGHEHATFRDYHWNLETMSSQLARAGFSIRRLYELGDTKSHTNTRGAPWLLIDAELRSSKRQPKSSLAS